MSTINNVLLYGYIIINLLLILFVLFFERKESARRFAWILILIFLPLAGIFFYILFSGHFFTKTKKMIRAKYYTNKILNEYLDIQKEYIKRGIEDTKHSLFSEFKTLINMNILYGNSALTLNNNVDVFLWGKDKFLNLFKDIESATDSIHLEYFIFRNDDIGNQLMNLLCKKAQEGVIVRLLYDDFGSLFTPASFFRRLKKSGGLVAPFFPVRLGMIFSLNYRNHRKIAVIDGKIAYTGGFNVGDEYINQSIKKKVLWRDTHIRVTGGSVLSLQLLFLMDWYGAYFKDKTLENKAELSRFFPIPNPNTQPVSNINCVNIPMQIVSCGPNDHHMEIRDAMIRMILAAKEYIYIQTPYFTPDDTFFAVLKIAATSGIDVRIMVPDSWDKCYAKAAAMEYIKEMLTYGIKFYHYPGFIHAKSIIIDGKIATIGTTNIDTRSFMLHFEVNAFFYCEDFAKEYEKIFISDQVFCRQSHQEEYNKRFILVRAWGGFCKLFSPFM